MTQDNSESALAATQGREAAGGRNHGLWWAEASIWTDRMVSALGNGVKGGKWFSLVDKVHRPTTLEAAWLKVARNKGSAGIDGQSIDRFAKPLALCSEHGDGGAALAGLLDWYSLRRRPIGRRAPLLSRVGERATRSETDGPRTPVTITQPGRYGRHA